MTDELLVTQEDIAAARAAQTDMLIGGAQGDKDVWRKVEQRFARHRLTQSKADAARIAALEEALRFYARPQSWRSSGVYMSGRSQATAAEIDGGERAREALEQTP